MSASIPVMGEITAPCEVCAQDGLPIPAVVRVESVKRFPPEFYDDNGYKHTHNETEHRTYYSCPRGHKYVYEATPCDICRDVSRRWR